jgi:RNA polymerase sigma factor (sigma-70 family)
MVHDIDSIAKNYGNMIISISHRMIENRDLARDAAQEAWLEIIKSLPTFRGESQLSTYIYKIASRTILRYSQKERLYSVRYIRDYLDGDELEYSEDAELEEKEWVKAICDKCITGSIHCLTNEERLIYLLFDVANLKSIEIADILTLSDLVVRKKMSRSRKKLHSFLNNQCILYNPGGNCKCRMVKNVIKMDIPKEFQRIKKDIQEMSFLSQCNAILLKNDSFIKDLCHNYLDSSTN